VRASRGISAEPRLGAGAQAFLASVTSRLALRDGRIDAQLCEPPRCSLSYGASGLAYLCYRLAVLRADPALLSTADAWSSFAQVHAARRDACDSAELGIIGAQVGSVSLHFRRPGIELVRALVSHAMGDWASCNAAVAAFLASARLRCGTVDLTTGHAGVLLACAALLEALPARDGLDRPAVEQHGRRVATRLAAILRRERVAQSTAIPWLGIAHGWAGVLFAALRWQQAVGAQLPGLCERLRELADLAEWHRAAAAWPLRSPTRHEDCRPRTGWCHGGAGYVQLWALADHLFPGDGYARFALGAASHLWTASQTGGEANGSLCCGYAGQAYALLTLFRWNGDREWLVKAHAMLDRALARAADAERRHSLYKGDAGIALLAAELTHPASSRMPLFEEEGWPRAP
jgi:hypothetical protein